MENTYIVLLRGINVGGKKPLKMAELRSSLSEGNFNNVITYIQSGNIVLSSSLNIKDTTSLVKAIIIKKFGYDLPIITINISEWEAMIDKNPMTENLDIKHLSVTVLSDNITDEQKTSLLSIENKDNQIMIDGRYVFQYSPNGYSKNKITNTKIEKITNSQATTRNWKTTLKMKEMADGLKV